MTNLFKLAALTASTGAAGTPAAGDTGSMLISLVPFILLIVVFYFMLIRPQRKRDKADANMRSSLIVGDTVTTRGGIVGTITNIKDDTITIETGRDKAKIAVMRWAIYAKDEKVSE